MAEPIVVKQGFAAPVEKLRRAVTDPELTLQMRKRIEPLCTAADGPDSTAAPRDPHLLCGQSA